ncbi:MAG: hypothetical protein WC456_02625 [Patescibacteria group bacterium]
MAINPLKESLRNASRDSIKEAIKNLRPHFLSGQWIGTGNIYAKYYKTNAYKDLLTRRSSLKDKQIKDYIAASVFNHCGDGWSLLGRALSLHIKGDGNSSIHLAYYAELRAAMSLLASEGIGVFNNRHVIVKDGAVDLTPSLKRKNRSLGRTHQFVWMALEHWTDRRLSADTLANIICPGSITLFEWLDAFGVANNIHPIGSKWMRLWGIDIKQFGDDQILRNYSSYRPSRILPKSNTTAPHSLAFFSELWRMCEPSPSSRFNEIDKHLLRSSLSQAYKAVYGIEPHTSTNLDDYRAWIEKKIITLNFSAPVQKEWVNFLTWAIQPDDSKIIEEAGKFTSVDDPSHHLQVLARATLLLRISTGINAKLLKEAGFTKKDLEFWWGPYAVDNGIIKNAGAISNFLDLWDDVNIALQDIMVWEKSQSKNYTYSDLVMDISKPILRLSECERISLWGLGI